MGFVEFANAVRRRSCSRPDRPALRNSLDSIVQLIQHEPHTPRGLVLTRVLATLCQDGAEFDADDIFALDAEAIALVDALISDWRATRYTAGELQGALAAVRWAEVMALGGIAYG
jgi:hypothetical protein